MQCACRGGCLRIGLILLVWYIDITATVFAAQAASQHLKFALNASRFLCLTAVRLFLGANASRSISCRNVFVLRTVDQSC